MYLLSAPDPPGNSSSNNASSYGDEINPADPLDPQRIRVLGFGVYVGFRF